MKKTRTHPFPSTKIQSPLLLAAVAALVLASCSSEAEAEPADAGAGQEEQSSGDSPEEEAPAVANAATTAEEGWSDLHDIPLPEPGTAVINHEGESYTSEITCEGPGVREDGHPISQFFIRAYGDFTLADGTDAEFSLERSVKVDNGEPGFYPYEDEGLDSASVRVTVAASEGGWHSSMLSSPSDDDDVGALLPLVHVGPDGGFTVREEFSAMMIHDEALEGEISIAGQCPNPWAENEE